MLGLFKKWNLNKTLEKLSDAITALDKAHDDAITALNNPHDEICNKAQSDKIISYNVESLAIRILMNKVHEEAVQLVIQNTKIKNTDDAIDKLIELFPDSFNMYSISTKFNVQHYAETSTSSHI